MDRLIPKLPLTASCGGSFSVFFDHLDLQIIKFNMFNKAVLAESCSGMALEIRHIAVQPDRIFQVKIIADLLQCTEDLVCSGIF